MIFNPTCLNNIDMYLLLSIKLIYTSQPNIDKIIFIIFNNSHINKMYPPPKKTQDHKKMKVQFV